MKYPRLTAIISKEEVSGSRDFEWELTKVLEEIDDEQILNAAEESLEKNAQFTVKKEDDPVMAAVEVYEMVKKGNSGIGFFFSTYSESGYFLDATGIDFITKELAEKFPEVVEFARLSRNVTKQTKRDKFGIGKK